MAHSLTHPVFPASASAFEARWTPQVDSRGVLNLKSCEMQHPAANRLLDELVAGLSAKDIYRYPYQGELISRLAEANDVDPECILLTPGSYTAIGIVVDALASPAGRLLLHEPAFDAWAYYSTLRGVPAISCAGLTSGLPPSLTTLPLLDAMAAAPPSVIALTNPGNPTGLAMPVDEVAELARVADKNGHMLVVDECYGAFCGLSHVPLISAYPNVIVLRSLSKSWALAGARLATIFGAAGVVDYLRRFRADAAISAPTVALATALCARTAALREIWADVASIRDRFASQVLTDHPTWTAFPSATNFVTFCTGRPGEGDQIEAALGGLGIRVRSLDGLPQLAGYFRISVAAQEQMDIVAGELRKLSSRKGEVTDDALSNDRIRS
jgi:histidinol-phosphate aminotransferase